MPRHQLTHRNIANARPTQQERLLADGDGLYLRVRPTGAKDWLFIYSFGGRRRKLGLGSADDVSLSQARERANEQRANLAQQIDPQMDKQRREAEQEAQRRELERQRARLTISQLFERWEGLELSGRKDKGAEVRRTFKKDVLPNLGAVAAEDVTRAMVAALLDRIVERGARIVARNLLGDLRQMFGFAIARGLLEHDPTSHMKRDDYGRKIERERVLTEEEIRALPAKLQAAKMHPASMAAVWIMLSTCCRVGELSQARWEDINVQAGTWRIPPDNAKNGKEHVVALSPFAVEQFRALRALALREVDGQKTESPWVLPARHNDGCVCVKSLAKQIGDRQRGTRGAMKKRSPNTNALVLPRGRWTPHDLRRTGATLMGTLGVRPDVIEKCLNHVEPNRMKRIYQRQELKAEQAEAWRLLGERLELLTGAAENVATLAARKAA